MSYIQNGLTEEEILIQAYLNKGEALVKLEKPDEALACFDKIIAIKKDNELLLKKGLLLKKLGRYEDSIEVLNQVIESISPIFAIEAEDDLDIDEIIERFLNNELK